MTATVNVVIVAGMLVAVPTGLRLIRGPGLAMVRRLWLAGAVPGAVSIWLSRGPAALALAVPYALLAAVLALLAPVRLARTRSLAPAEIAVLAALVAPAVAGVALIAERGGTGCSVFGHVAGLPHLPLAWMVATHGVANAFGFALCGLAAWYRLRRAVGLEEAGHEAIG